MEQAHIILNKAQWRNLHNALCNAEREAGQLFSVLKDGGEGLVALQSVRDALAPAYAQDNAAFDRKNNYFDQVRDENQLRSIWSLYDETDVGLFEQPHPYGTATQLVYSQHWGNKPVVVEIQGNTWLDLYRAADTAIQQSGDSHHIFIERFSCDCTESSTIHLSTGS
jgi:hypothetical protein